MNNLRVRIFRLQLQLLTLVLFSIAASAQSPREKRSIFAKAESYFLFEEYELANQLYILLDTPDNNNIKYKIGTCYINIPGEKEKAIPYLESAVGDASYDAKPESFKEVRAPLDAYFYLAKSYMINNELEKGLVILQTFDKLATETESKGGMKNTGYIDQQILACKNAIRFRENPVEMSKENLGPGFNQGSISDNPAVSFDGNSIVYTETRGMVNVILYSRKEKDRWQTPVEITSTINAGEDCSSCSLNNDGTLLFLYKNDSYDGNIYTSELVNGNWNPIKKLNRNINTKFYESHASVSADGKKLYFTSNRDGGSGGLDIYVSEKDASGDWGPAVNLGTSINTMYNEDTPFITDSGSFLYFCSEGHDGMGGFDNFRSQRLGTIWETPQNLGFPINTTDDDKFLLPVNDGRKAFYSMTTDYKKKEIFYLSFGNTSISKTYEIRGRLSLQDTSIVFSGRSYIHLLDRKSGDTLDIGYPNKFTGSYYFNVTPGKYRIIYTGTGHFQQTIDTVVLQDNPEKAITLNVTLLKDPAAVKFSGPSGFERIVLTDLPIVSAIDSSILIKNMNVNDIDDKNIKDSDILYYTVQVMALYNPVDISYFKYITDLRVMYNDTDKFYRYITGQFRVKEEALAFRLKLIRLGYPQDLFVKKVSR